ncbi:ADP-ribosylglycohydrolase family protein [Serinibacter arcticus]|uniref:Putative membrane protein n=1 Tax=Serinibacter arcticus TaxID=1655435 RepID=A0A4Z1E3Z6_9MICO|nr:ADP-ribosylglycohydrolase family protein [Serinibacter arcticus]TGO06666.1 putative membrane protein [Serinibacter arcticus]
MRLTWAQPEDLLPHELVALAEQGADRAVLDDVATRWVAAGGSPVPPRSGAGDVPATTAVRALARRLLAELAHATPRSAEEPDGWEAIEALLPAAAPAPGPSNVLDVPSLARYTGAWTGRAVGCVLGKPVEKIPREGIEAILRAGGRWPLSDYFSAVGLPDDVARAWPWNRRSAPTSLAENVDGAPEDDDLNFPILALHLLHTHGAGLSTDQVAQGWLDNLPGGRVFTAERAAYRNLLDGREAPETATHLNPFREWIGALIRTDAYGWVHPGDVRSAARLAWTDARLSHTRNGLYGAMWAAALCSAAVALPDPQARDDGGTGAVLDLADTVVPPRSRLAGAIALGRELAASGRPQAEVLVTLHAELGHLHWVHTLNNAALIAYAVAASRGDVAAGVTAAVLGGWDTDSAGATVGSVLGGLGAPIGAAWTGPIDGRIATSMPGGAQRRIEDLAARTRELAVAFRSPTATATATATGAGA